MRFKFIKMSDILNYSNKWYYIYIFVSLASNISFKSIYILDLQYIVYLMMFVYENIFAFLAINVLYLTYIWLAKYISLRWSLFTSNVLSLNSAKNKGFSNLSIAQRFCVISMTNMVTLCLASQGLLVRTEWSYLVVKCIRCVWYQMSFGYIEIHE